MASVSYKDRKYPLLPGETVLDGLLRQGVDVPNSCRAGACQSCLMRDAGGNPPVASQQGLKESLKAQGYFLACQCKPETDLRVIDADGISARAAAHVQDITMLSGDVARVRLECKSTFDYRPGQFIQLVRNDGLSRSYSLASQGKRDTFLELHVRKIPGGSMSNWIHDEMATGDEVEVRGPAGDCFYIPGRPEQPLLLAGTGTGLAPLYALALDALHHGHTGPIRLYHGALNPAGLYMVRELTELCAEHPNLTYIPCVLTADDDCDPAIRVGNLEQIVLRDIAHLADWRIFLCGHPDLVQSLRKKVFLAGAKRKEIYSDAFVMRTPEVATAPPISAAALR
jgi:CDP-4-dehydro-6-deoxyglucose reductase